MKIANLHSMHLSLVAALGLTLACASRPGADGSGETNDSGDGDGDTGEGDTGEPHLCENPEPILQAGTEAPSGFVMCADGFIHRSEALDALDPVGLDAASCAMDEFGLCQTGADCVDQDYGRCVNDIFGGCLCDYGCAVDADCNAGFICAPAGIAGEHSTCIPGDCTVDADCDGGLCGLSVYDGCCGTSYQLGCAQPDEACHVDAECAPGVCFEGVPDAPLVDFQCAIQSDFGDQDGEWTCKSPGYCNCDCGRPFFVGGEARVADRSRRADWSVALEPACADLDEATRSRLADHWASIAAFEHASVASFARFALQLLELGAPPALVRDTQRALADEIEHARLAFGLAQAYAGEPLGPAGLGLDHALDERGLEAIVEGLIVEACVGETLAALEAREAALWAADPVVAAALEQIADDEWRHAELGWRTLGWLLRQHGPSLTAFVEARFAAVLAELEAAEIGSDRSEPADRGLRVHGVLDAQLRGAVRRAGLDEVLRPCVAALAARDSVRDAQAEARS